LEHLKKIGNFPQETIPKNRWGNIPTILSLDQLGNLIALLGSFLPENATPMEKLEKIIFNENESEIQIHHLKNRLQKEISQKLKFIQRNKELEEEVQLLRDHLNSEIISKNSISETARNHLQIEMKQKLKFTQRNKELEEEVQLLRDHLNSEIISKNSRSETARNHLQMEINQKLKFIQRNKELEEKFNFLETISIQR
jgi:hypothetical protein